MKTAVERLNPTRVKLNLTVTPADLKPALDNAYKTVAAQVNIPGFRKGKAPAAIIDQRVGRGAVLAQAINDGLDDFYRSAMESEKLRPMGTPKADVKTTPDEKTFEGNLEVEIEVEVRPEIKLPAFKGREIKLEDVKVEKEAIDAEIDALRARFGTLKTVDRAAKSGDFTVIDLSATIDGKLIDSATEISYEIGSGQLLDGIDDALETLTAGETTTFKSKLVGGDAMGQEAEVEVTLTAVQERELPELNDEFAQLASEFDTVAELRADIEKKLASFAQQSKISAAREELIDQLIEEAKVPVSEEIVNLEVHNHLEGEGRLEDDEHRKEVIEESTRNFRRQILLDAIVEAEELKVDEQELIQHLSIQSQRYGMEPGAFIRQLANAGQIPLWVADMARQKAAKLIIESAEVKDAKGNKVEVNL